MNWVRFSMLEGVGSTCGQWKVLRRPGDAIFNVYQAGKLVAIGFTTQRAAEAYAERREARS